MPRAASVRLFRFLHALRSNLWLVPMLGVLTGALIALGTLSLDRNSGYTLVPQSLTGSPTDAQTILSVFATATASLISLVLTVTLVAVQLAMGQFSPRIVAALLTDRFSQLSIGLFGATFVVAVLTLREIRDSAGTVPGLSMLLTYALMLASLVTLILFVNHAGQGLRAAGLIDLVGDRTRGLIEREYPADPHQDDPDVIGAPEPGIVFGVDRPAIVAAAQRADCVIQLVPIVGDFLPAGAPLFRIHRRPGNGPANPSGAQPLRPGELAALVAVTDERVHSEDPAYGIRKLVDIAERSIAQPFDDPTTTVQALHRLHDLLRQLARRPFPTGEHRDEDGVVRLVERTLTWDGYVDLAFTEIRLAGIRSPQITRLLCAVLKDLTVVAPPDRQAALERHLHLIAAGVHRAYEDDEDIAAALTPDNQGIGSGADVTSTLRLGEVAARSDVRTPARSG
jgi:uncharacterized membrane protein